CPPVDRSPDPVPAAIPDSGSIHWPPLMRSSPALPYSAVCASSRRTVRLNHVQRKRHVPIARFRPADQSDSANARFASRPSSRLWLLSSTPLSGTSRSHARGVHRTLTDLFPAHLIRARAFRHLGERDRAAEDLQRYRTLFP